MGAIDPIRLTPTMVSRKLQVLAFIKAYHGRHGEGPSLMEIANAIGTNKSRVQGAIRRLQRDGLLYYAPGQARGVWPLEARDEALRLLRLQGWIVDEQIGRVSPPPASVTNASLSWPPVLDYSPDDERDDLGGAGADGAEEKRGR